MTKDKEKQDHDKGVSVALREYIDEAAGVLAEMLPDFDMGPDIPDDEIEDAILRLTPEGRERLDMEFGRENVTDFLNEFTRRRKL